MALFVILFAGKFLFKELCPTSSKFLSAVLKLHKIPITVGFIEVEHTVCKILAESISSLEIIILLKRLWVTTL